MVWIVFRIFAQLFRPVDGIVCRTEAEVGRLPFEIQNVSNPGVLGCVLDLLV